MGCSHPGLDGAEGMFDRLAALAHLLRMLVEPALNGFENVLMFPSGDPSFLAGGASGLDCTALADVGPVAAQHQTVFLGRRASRRQDKRKCHSGSPACRSVLRPLRSRSSALAA